MTHFKKIHDTIRYRLLKQVPLNRPFVFGVGLSKTGTTSLNDALAVLGYNAFHLPPICRAQNGQIVQDWPWWVYKYNALTDMTVALLFRELDQQFPNARFIYTPREMNGWLQSCARHFTPELAAARVAQGQSYLNDLCREFYGSEIFDPDSYRAAYLKFDREIRTHFHGRSDFLICDIVGGAGWDEICAFLNRPQPDLPFPKSNRGRAIPLE
jgi:hypothetical protein